MQTYPTICNGIVQVATASIADMKSWVFAPVTLLAELILVSLPMPVLALHTLMLDAFSCEYVAVMLLSHGLVSTKQCRCSSHQQ